MDLMGRIRRHWDNPMVRPRIYGFIGWFVVNGAFWLVMQPQAGFYGLGIFLPFMVAMPLNIVAFLIFLARRRQVALGILAAVATNFVVTLFLQMMVHAICGIPLFVPVGKS